VSMAPPKMHRGSEDLLAVAHVLKGTRAAPRMAPMRNAAARATTRHTPQPVEVVAEAFGIRGLVWRVVREYGIPYWVRLLHRRHLAAEAYLDGP